MVWKPCRQVLKSERSIKKYFRDPPILQNRSADNSKSGRNGYRPPGHARDNIPKKVTTKKGEVGWELNGDAQNWFYMKFVEWGTSKMPPRDFLNNTKSECESEYHMIADQEYQKALNEKLGG